MNKLIIIICVFLSIFLVKLYSIEKLEHLTLQSDEAIQNLSSMYNKDQLTIGALNVTGIATANSFTDRSMNTTIKAYIDAKIAAVYAKAAVLTGQINAVSTRTTNAQNGVNSLNSSTVKKNIDFTLRARTNSYNRQPGIFNISDGLSPRLYTSTYKPKSYGTAMYISQ
jgi:uncharacterized membrane protein